MMLLYILLLLSAAGRQLVSAHASDHPITDGLPRKNVTDLGDINIAVIHDMTYHIEIPCVIKPGPLRPGQVSYKDCSHLGTPTCHEDDVNIENIWFPNMVEYIMNEINTNASWKLPNNLKLGYILLDSCDKERVVTDQALSFWPQKKCSLSASGGETCEAVSYDEKEPVHHDIVGMVCCGTGDKTLMVHNILHAASIPVVSYSYTSEELYTMDHEYFFGTATPDIIQYNAVYHLIRHYKWDYISVIYIDAPFGKNGLKFLKSFLDYDNDICLPKMIKTGMDVDVKEAGTIADTLLEAVGRVRVIVLFHTRFRSIQTIVEQVSKAFLNKYGVLDLIWIGTADMTSRFNYTDDDKELLLGSFCMVPSKTDVPQFYQALDQTKLTDAMLTNPWLANATQTLFNCEPNQCPPDLTLGQRRHKQPAGEFQVGELFDAFLMVAKGISRVLDQCTTLLQSPRQCIARAKLREALNTTDIIGYSGRIALKNNKWRKTNYNIAQWVREGKEIVIRKVAVFFPEKERLEFLEDGRLVQWPKKWTSTPPDGTCGTTPLCRENERKVVLDVKCCWQCLPCKKNERLNQGRNKCVPCKKYTWPDENDRTALCREIPVSYVSLELGKGLESFVLVMVMVPVYLCVCAVLLYYRNTRVVVYHNRLLAVFMLLGIGIGYVFVLQQYTQSSEMLCHFAYVFLCLSFALIYGPLMLRTLDNYRAYRAYESQTLYERMSFRTQLTATFVIISIELLMWVTLEAVLDEEWKVKTQQGSGLPYVEEGCIMPEPALWLFMAYATIFLCCSAILSAITRHVPHDVYNAARFISMSFSATIIILLCFFPAYLLSEGVVLKEVMLSLVVSINHILALAFLAGPSLYALVYMQGARDVLSSTEQLAPFVNMFGTQRSRSFDTVDFHAWSTYSGQHRDT